MTARALRLLALAAPLAFAAAQTQVREIEHTTPATRFGTALASCADFDGDGRGDLAIGAPFESTATGPSGRVFIVSTHTHAVLLTLDGEFPGERFGWSIADAGDLDGDGRSELIVGAPYWNGAMGRIAVYDGASGTVRYSINGAYSHSLVGWSVAGAGFVDGDAAPDFLVGEPQYGANYHGYLRIYSGATGLLIVRQQENGPLGRFRMGYAATFLGDVDGDGRDEYVAGCPGEGPQSAPGVCAYDGASGQLLWEVVGPTGGSEFGASLARLGDLDGDGVPELAVGAPETGCASLCPLPGFVSILSGATGGLLRTHAGAQSQAAFGHAVSGLTDLDGDGLDEYAITQPGATVGSSGDGALAIFSGTGALLAEIAPTTAGIGWGAALACGDVTGDGLSDISIGASHDDSGGINAGAVRAFSVVRAPTAFCESEINSLGCTPAMSSAGTASASLASVFDVRATSVLNHKSGLLFYGFIPRQAAFQGGHMCVVAPTKRTPVQSSGGNAPPISDCSGVFSLDFNARIQSSADPLLVAGEEVFAQYWSRDPADQSTTNLTDALAFWITP